MGRLEDLNKLIKKKKIVRLIKVAIKPKDESMPANE